MNSGKQIIRQWAEESLRKREDGRLPLDPDSGHYAGILSIEWQALVDRIDTALRETKQDGLDYRKQNKLLSEESEFGPFWSEFYKKGGPELPGLPQAFSCLPDEHVWVNQWNEVIRVSFKKPTLRAVDPGDFLFSLQSSMKGDDWLKLSDLHDRIIKSLVDTCVDESKPSWTPAMLKRK